MPSILVPFRRRIMIQKTYSASELEQCLDTTKLIPLRVGAIYIHNKEYESYNTMELVREIAHSKDFMTSSEVLERLQPTEKSLGAEYSLKRRYRNKK